MFKIKKSLLRFFYRIKRKRLVIPIAIAIVVIIAIIVIVNIAVRAEVEPALVDSSNSANATANSPQRKTFYDPDTYTHWSFDYNGSVINFSHSLDGITWTKAGSLAYNTANFSIAYKKIATQGYVLIVVENGEDISLHQGQLSATNIAFAGEATVFNGTSNEDRYTRPTLVIDDANYVWVAARYYSSYQAMQIRARKSAELASGNLAPWGAVYNIGIQSDVLQDIVMVPQTGGKVMMITGNSSKNITAFEFDGTNWTEASTGGGYSWFNFPSGISEAVSGAGQVSALAVVGQDLYVGGEFSAINTLEARNVAKFTPATGQWAALGGGIHGVNYRVWSLAAVGNDLFVGGEFDQAGAITVNYIAKYSIPTGAWSDMAGGVDYDVYAMKGVGNDTLYVGGAFNFAGGVEANYIAKYTVSTNTWSALNSGNPGVDGDVMTIASLGNDLYLGGYFALAGGVTVNGIAKYTPATSTWSALNTGTIGTDGTVGSIVPYGNDTLYVGGSFSQAGSVSANLVAKYTISTQTWEALGGGLSGDPSPFVNSMVIENGFLYVGGQFANANGSIPVNRIAKFELATNTWSAMGFGTDSWSNQVYTLAVLSGKLYVGGNFFRINDMAAHYLASYNLTNGSWSEVPASTAINTYQDYIFAMAVLNDEIYVGGWFQYAAGIRVNNIAKYSPITSTWSALPGAEPGVHLENNIGRISDADVASLQVVGSDLYIGGAFDRAGGIIANNIVKFTPATGTWSALGEGTGAQGTQGERVQALGNIGNDLYVGGRFDQAGGIMVNRIAKYNITTGIWSALNEGTVGVSSTVNNILAWDNDTLYVGGTFTTAGGQTANHIVRYKPSSQTWEAMGTGMMAFGNNVYALEKFGEDLYVGGSFSAVSGVAANNIAKYTPATDSWAALNSGYPGVSSKVEVIRKFNNDKLAVGGIFGNAGGTPTGTIAFYEPLTQTWSALNTQGVIGSNSGIYDIVILGPNLFAGGEFTQIKGVSTGALAIYAEAVGGEFTDTSTEISAVADEAGNVHLIYTDNQDKLQYKTYSLSNGTWQPAVTLVDSETSSPTISIDRETGELWAFYIRNSNVYHRRALTPYDNPSWQPEVADYTTGANFNLNSSYFAGTCETFIMWTNGNGPAFQVFGHYFGTVCAPPPVSPSLSPPITPSISIPISPSISPPSSPPVSPSVIIPSPGSKRSPKISSPTPIQSYPPEMPKTGN